MKRKSNLELLRIFAMILIVMHHYALYSGFEIIDFSINNLWIDFFRAFGKLGVCLFILISGYFYNKSNFNIKKIVYLVSKVWIYSILALIIGIFFKSNVLNFWNILKSIFPNILGLYWFASCYVLIYLLSPYIKILIDNITKKEFKILLFLLITIFFIISMIPKSKTFCNELINLIVIYMIGAYISKYNILLDNSKNTHIIITTFILLFYIIIIFGLEFLSHKVNVIEQYIFYFNSLNSPITLILSILIFQLFNSLNINENKLINKIATTTFGIYLFHENVFIRNFIWKNIVCGAKYESNIILIFNSIFGVIIVFCVGVIIDLFIERFIHKNVMILFNKIYKKISSLKIFNTYYLKIEAFYNK